MLSYHNLRLKNVDSYKYLGKETFLTMQQRGKHKCIAPLLHLGDIYFLC